MTRRPLWHALLFPQPEAPEDCSCAGNWGIKCSKRCLRQIRHTDVTKRKQGSTDLVGSMTSYTIHIRYLQDLAMASGHLHSQYANRKVTADPCFTCFDVIGSCADCRAGKAITLPVRLLKGKSIYHQRQTTSCVVG